MLIMLQLRRHDLAPRLELLPMIDVIFLLLTFFIYSLIFMVRAEVMPIELIPLAGAQQAGERTLSVLTLDSQGRLFLDREPVDDQTLNARLRELAAAPTGDAPRLYLAVEATPGQVDRGPILIELIDRVRAAGVNDFAIVGPPAQPSTPQAPATEP